MGMKERIQRSGALNMVKSRRGSNAGGFDRGTRGEQGGDIALSSLDAEIAGNKKAKRGTRQGARRSSSVPTQRPDAGNAPPWQRQYQDGDLMIDDL